MAASQFELPERDGAPAVDDREAPALQIGRLYEQHYRMIRALCQLLLRNPTDAEDAAQQTFLSAFASLIDGTVPRQPAPWLATIARRECWARSAQRRRQPLALDEATAPPSANNPLEEAIRNVDLAALWRAIDDLPRQQRNAFLMREFSGLPYSEVAEALGATESAIESLLVRARRQLRDGLDAANALATPVVLLHHRLARLLGERRAGAAAAGAGIPTVAKLGATVAGVVAVSSAGVGAAVLQSNRTAPHASARVVAETTAHQRPLVEPTRLDRLIGREAAATLFPYAGSWSMRGDAASTLMAPAGPISTGDPSPPLGGTATAPSSASGANATPLGAAPADGTPPADATATDTQPSDASPSDASGTGTDTAPTDTTPTDPSTTDTSPVDTTTDPSTTDTSSTDTTSLDATPADTTPANALQVAPASPGETTTDPPGP